MTDDKHGLFSKFIKMKPPVFQGIEFEDVFEFLIDFHECLNKLGIVKKYGVEFVSF